MRPRSYMLRRTCEHIFLILGRLGTSMPSAGGRKQARASLLLPHILSILSWQPRQCACLADSLGRIRAEQLQWRTKCSAFCPAPPASSLNSNSSGRWSRMTGVSKRATLAFATGSAGDPAMVALSEDLEVCQVINGLAQVR